MTNEEITQNYGEIIEKTVGFVKDKLKEAEGGHDWYHIQRVWNNALHIADIEGTGNRLVIELAALLHDIADAKFHNGDESIGPKLAGDHMKSLALPEVIMDKVIFIIENISFRKHHQNNTANSVELQIVQDADRLDALGAIGIARAFNYGGFKNRPLYEPQELKETAMPSLITSSNHTIGHFYEKLLLLKGLMNTPTGKQMAEERHSYMVTFLNEFYKEWEGKK